MPRGIDVHQDKGNVDWQRVKAAGYSFAFLKVSEGGDFPASAEWWQQESADARSHGIAVGGYHFARQDTIQSTVEEEVDFFLGRLNLKPDDLLPVVDWENPAGKSIRPDASWLLRMLKRIESRIGRKPILYSYPHFLDQTFLGATAAERAELITFPLWLASYGPNDGQAHPYTEKWGFKVIAHQYTSRGRVPGVPGDVDLNVNVAPLAAFTFDPTPLPRPQSSMTIRQIQSNLTKIGFPIRVDGKLGTQTRQAILDFKQGWAYWTPLMNRKSSKPGPGFKRALKKSVEKGGACSTHFKYREFACNDDKGVRCNGWIRVDYRLVRGLEKLRKKLGRPIGVLSGFRCAARNVAVGGASESQHVPGNAIDPKDFLGTVEQVRSVKAFSGIGYQIVGDRRMVRHVDVRHTGPRTTGGTPDNPTIWRYG